MEYGDSWKLCEDCAYSTLYNASYMLSPVIQLLVGSNFPFQLFSVVLGTAPQMLSALVALHFDRNNLDPGLMQDSSSLIPSTANSFSAPPPLPSLSPPSKPFKGANKKNAVPGSCVPAGSEKFCLLNYKNKKMGR